MVTMRSRSGKKLERMLSRVVLPVDVPPEMTMLSRANTHAWKNSAISSVKAPRRIRSSVP